MPAPGEYGGGEPAELDGEGALTGAGLTEACCGLGMAAMAAVRVSIMC